MTYQPHELAAPALRTFFNISAAWKLTETEQAGVLGLSNPSALASLRQGRIAAVGAQMLERLSLVIGIFGALNTIFSQPEVADNWVRRPNRAPAFAGRTAVDLMTTGNVDDLYVLRCYLDAQCH